MFFNNISNYNQYAIAQSQIADIFIKWIADSKILQSNLDIIEIGCGTGILTEKIIQRYPNKNVVLIDQSKAMLDACRNKFIKNNNITYINDNAEYIFNTNLYTANPKVFLSNMCMHWLQDINLFLEKLISFKHKIAFTIPTTNSFLYWQNIHAELNINCHLQNLISMQQIQQFNYIKDIKYINIPLVYSSILDFIKHFKFIDAYTNKNLYSIEELRKLIKYKDHTQIFKTEYEIAIILCEK